MKEGVCVGCLWFGWGAANVGDMGEEAMKALQNERSGVVCDIEEVAEGGMEEEWL